MLKKTAAYFLPVLLLLLIGIESNAATACFTPSALKGCVPFTITLDPSCAVYSPAVATPQYTYDNSGTSTLSTTHTYNTPGTYRIVQYIDGSATGQTYRDILVTASPDPVFTVKSCAGRNVTLTMDPISASQPYDNFDINWGDGSTVQNVAPGSVTTHTFSSDGFQSVTVTGKFSPNASCGSKTVLPYAISTLVKPDLAQLKVLAQHSTNGQIQITYDSKMGQFYKIERSTNGGPYDSVGFKANNSAFPATPFLDKNLNTQTNVYQYRVVAYDDCGLQLYSDPIYSIIIKATPTNALNTVTWNTDPTVNSFILTKNSTPIPFIGTTSFADNAITCGNSYCYQNIASLTTLTVSGVAQVSISIDTCITAISTTIPPAVQDVNSTMNGSNVTVSWASAGSGISYKLYQVSGTSSTQLTQQTATTYSYNLPDLSSSYCYQLDYADLCSNSSPKSLTTCPVILHGTVSGTTITLNWNAYTGYNNTGVQSYAVQKIDQNGIVLLETNVGLSTTFSETVNLNDPYVNYIIKVYPTNSAFANSFSNNSLFKFEAEVFVPDIFTPNGDGTNDYFIVKGKYVNTYSINIYSRWGEVVYSSTEMLAGWNGFNNFVYAPEGAYTYKIIATDINNKEFTKTGTVTLTR
ncbi:T9SS C-terminal target domain-containing protein [Cytophaga aurantiaca]|uniref:T9SS C-terminal target domain-containing protein n=1 Tax=Cytophaga aurantiaca TaxID=29530 RepID=UPI00037B7402|nr:T9SS C-terminal target domain-containing protein [Cytophaga aurantiaca]